jgi:hypothetical protein
MFALCTFQNVLRHFEDLHGFPLTLVSKQNVVGTSNVSMTVEANVENWTKLEAQITFELKRKGNFKFKIEVTQKGMNNL